jgi:hypothetical protein
VKFSKTVCGYTSRFHGFRAYEFPREYDGGMLTNESGIPFPSVFNPLDGLQRCCSFGISGHPYLQLFLCH